MRFYNVPLDELQRYAHELGFQFQGEDISNSRGYRARGVLRPGTGPEYRKLSIRWGRARKVHAICWHGHREFLSAMFRGWPGARVSSMLADYRGQDNFLATFEDTGAGNVGSQAYPVRADESCNCHLV